MSRIRSVKPELFKHEDLFDAEQNSKLPLRLAFIGLFAVADCEGRFKWRPRTIKLEVLPHDFIDFSAILNALEKAGFIQRYEANGETYGWIPSFKKHQRFQTKELEAGSSLPPPPTLPGAYGDDTGTQPGRYRDDTGTQPGHSGREGKGREEEGKRKGKERAPARNTRSPTAKTPFPADFAITPELQVWATEHGYGDLETHLDSFRDKAQAKGYQYTDWVAAFRNAVRDDWAGLRKTVASQTAATAHPGQLSKAGEQQRRNLEAWIQQDAAEVAAHEIH